MDITTRSLAGPVAVAEIADRTFRLYGS